MTGARADGDWGAEMRRGAKALLLGAVLGGIMMALAGRRR
jgi:hypothetical protein